MKIKWTNKWSGETGYVKAIHNKEQYFENTFDADEAKNFSVHIIKKSWNISNSSAPTTHILLLPNSEISDSLILLIPIY